MRSQSSLHNILLNLGITNVYFQPPATKKMEYPCILYKKKQKLILSMQII